MEPCEWSIEIVQQWLESNSLGEYVHSICFKHKINGNCLISLNKNEIRQIIGTSCIFDIKNLIYHVKQLKYMHDKQLSVCDEKHNPECYRLMNIRLKSMNLSKNIQEQDIKEEFSCYNDLSFSKEWRKCLFSLIYWLSSLFLTCVVMTIVHNRVPNMDKYPPLPDIMLDNIPYIPWAFEVCEILLLVQLTLFTIIFCFHKYRHVILKRLWAISGSVFLLRCITLMVTSLSVPCEHFNCSPEVHTGWSNILHRSTELFINGALSLNGMRNCGDYMFSGHTSVLTLLNFFICEYSPHDWTFLRTLSWIFNVIGGLLILASHEHYSIDVVIAFYISMRIFQTYHTLSTSKTIWTEITLKHRIWYPMLYYLEENTCGNHINNRFENPLVLIFKFIYSKLFCKKNSSSFKQD